MAKKRFRRPRSQPSDADFIDPVRLRKELIAYAKQAKPFKAAKKQVPPFNDYIGRSVVLMSQRLASAGNFSQYTYKDEFISEGILNCTKYLHNYRDDPKKSPFAYVTTILFNSFRRVIRKEKLERYKTYKLAMDMNDPDFTRWFHASLSGVENQFQETFGFREDEKWVVEIEGELKRTSKRRKKKGQNADNIF